MVKVAPSLLSADFSRLAEEVRKVENAGADCLHVDVMDGHFVPNISMGQPVVKSLRKVTELPLDVHLMIEEPDRYLKDFVEAGADVITVHPEANVELGRTIDTLRKMEVGAGVALRPSTPLETIEDYLGDLDMVMIMAVKPGFGGQKFMTQVLDKIRELDRIFDGEIEIDGGVNLETAPAAVEAGADILVAGTAVFGSDDPAETVEELRKVGSK